MSDTPDSPIPFEHMTSSELMAEIDRLTAALADRDATIAELRAGVDDALLYQSFVKLYALLPEATS